MTTGQHFGTSDLQSDDRTRRDAGSLGEGPRGHMIAGMSCVDLDVRQLREAPPMARPQDGVQTLAPQPSLRVNEP